MIPNADFAQGVVGGLPECWTLSKRDPAAHPAFALIDTPRGRALEARGNGRDDCFGWIETAVPVDGGRHFRFRVTFRVDGIDDVNRHVIHGVYATDPKDGGFNNGVFNYTRHADGSIVGESLFAGPKSANKLAVRLYLRYTPAGRVMWENVSLQQVPQPPPRLAKIAVVKGHGPFELWPKVLDEAGKAGCDIALLPEEFDGNYDAGKGVSMDSPGVRLLAAAAAKYRMYTAGALYVKDGDCTHNRTPLFDRTGRLLGVHDKVVLYDPEVEAGATGGREFNVFQCDFGRVGVMTCYESWYPGVAQLLALKGAELILFPSAGYYEELIHARAADNGVVIAASSLGCAGDVWDPGGNRAGGEPNPDCTRNAPTSITRVERLPALGMLLVTVDLDQHPSPHSWGGPMYSAPGGRRVRNTSLLQLEDEIAEQIRRW